MRTRLPVLTLASLLLIGCSSDPQTPVADARPAVAESRQTPATAALAAAPVVEPSAHVVPPAVSSPKTRERTLASSEASRVPSASPTPDQPAVAETKPPPPTPVPTSPVATPQPTRPAPAPALAQVTAVTDIGGMVEVGATKPGLTRIGAAKCKLCHKVQFDSWAKTKHATRAPPLDCESCHGAGSEYKALAIMKDPKKALAAGLVTPGRMFCSKCHTGAWSDDLLKRSHAHKAGA